MRKTMPLVLLALMAVLCSCLPLRFSGSNVPTPHVFRLTEADIAYASSDKCRLEWVTSDPAHNRDRAREEIEGLGVRLQERRLIPGKATALRGRLLLPQGIWDWRVFAQAMLFTHERGHYCQREQMGDNAFDLAYAHSAGRWRVEVPTYAQSIRTAVAQGATSQEMATYIDDLLVSFPTDYLTWDIDPEQYQAQTRKIWEEAAQLGPSGSG